MDMDEDVGVGQEWEVVDYLINYNLSLKYNNLYKNEDHKAVST